VAASDAPLELAISEKDIRKRVRELASEINRDYAGKTLQVVGILEECFVFMADLVRALTVPLSCSFVGVQVHDDESGRVAMREIRYLPPANVGGKDVLLVQGVLETGVTLDYLRRAMSARQPASLRIAVLLDKAEDRRADVPADYVGFRLGRKFVVGYGLGWGEQYRHLPFLARLREPAAERPRIGR